ncbi:MAG: histone deacetylase [Spirochaetota bacterium]
MQLLFYPNLPGLQHFGIQIPVLDTRATATIEALQQHTVIGPHMDTLLSTERSEEISREDIARVHSPPYVQDLYSDRLEALLFDAYELIDEHGRYNRYKPELAQSPLTDIFPVMRTRTAGSLQCMRNSLNEGFCFYFGGGFHHAHAGFGHGFCIINDIVIGIRRLQSEGLIGSAWVIDGDAHKGDGTAALTADDDSIATLSIHMDDGWPLDLPRFDADGNLHPSFIPSTVDIPIRSGEEPAYVERLNTGLLRLEQALAQPDIAVVVFGADPYEHDGLDSAAKLKLSLEQLKARDTGIYDFLSARGIPAAYLMAGGYGPQAWEVNYQFLEWVLRERGGLQSC